MKIFEKIFRKKRVKLEVKDIKSIDLNIPRPEGIILSSVKDGVITLKNGKQYTIWDKREHNGWGDRIDWFEAGKILEGHSRDVSKGDFVISEMASGRDGLYRIKGLRRPGDPLDQFFADVYSVGYVDEIEVRK